MLSSKIILLIHLLLCLFPSPICELRGSRDLVFPSRLHSQCLERGLPHGGSAKNRRVTTGWPMPILGTEPAQRIVPVWLVPILYGSNLAWWLRVLSAGIWPSKVEAQLYCFLILPDSGQVNYLSMLWFLALENSNNNEFLPSRVWELSEVIHVNA